MDSYTALFIHIPESDYTVTLKINNPVSSLY